MTEGSTKSSHNPNAAEEDIREEVRMIIEKILRTMSTEGDSIELSTVVGERTTQYIVNCKRQHIGKIMGSKGKNINAIRTVAAAMLGNHGMRGIVEIPYFERD